MLVNLIRFLRISYRGQGSLEVQTDIPGPALAVAATFNLPNVATRQQLRLRLPVEARGITLRVRVTADGAGILIPYELAIYAKALGSGVTAWRWMQLPIPGVSEEWMKFPIPIPPTPEDWTKIPIPIPATPEEFQRIQIVSSEGTDYKWEHLPSGEA